MPGEWAMTLDEDFVGFFGFVSRRTRWTLERLGVFRWRAEQNVGTRPAVCSSPLFDRQADRSKKPAYPRVLRMASSSCCLSVMVHPMAPRHLILSRGSRGSCAMGGRHASDSWLQ